MSAHKGIWRSFRLPTAFYGNAQGRESGVPKVIRVQGATWLFYAGPGNPFPHIFQASFYISSGKRLPTPLQPLGSNFCALQIPFPSPPILCPLMTFLNKGKRNKYRAQRWLGAWGLGEWLYKQSIYREMNII